MDRRTLWSTAGNVRHTVGNMDVMAAYYFVLEQLISFEVHDVLSIGSILEGRYSQVLSSPPPTLSRGPVHPCHVIRSSGK